MSVHTRSKCIRLIRFGGSRKPICCIIKHRSMKPPGSGRGTSTNGVDEVKVIFSRVTQTDDGRIGACVSRAAMLSCTCENSATGNIATCFRTGLLHTSQTGPVGVNVVCLRGDSWRWLESIAVVKSTASLNYTAKQECGERTIYIYMYIYT